MPKCRKCFGSVPSGSKFCNHCGAPIKKENLYRRPDGLYELIVSINGKRVVFRAKTEDDVFEKILNYKHKAEKGPTFYEVAEMWYDEHWETLSPTTQRGYSYAFKEIEEYFKTDYIKQITHKDINKYVKQLDRSYARKTCQTRLMLLNMIFKFAITEDIIEDNPSSYITIKGHSSKKRRAPTEAEINKIKANIGVEYKGFAVGLLAVFLLYTGCRKGEALALLFKDIKDARISITKSVYYVSNSPQIKKPKTEAGNREIIIPQYLLNIMPKGKPSEYVFSSFPDKPMKQHFFDKAWSAWQKETGLELTAHQLRHGYATILHEADIDVKDAQSLLGHADASTTQNIYTEVSEKRKITVEQRLNDYLQ